MKRGKVKSNGGKFKKMSLPPHQRKGAGMLKIKGKFETRQGEMAGNLKRCLTASIQDRYRSMTGTSSRMLWPRFVFHWPLRLFRLQSQQ